MLCCAVQLAPCLAGLSQTALDPEVEPAATGEAKLLLRCLGALLRKHALLLPDMSLTLIELLLAGCSASRWVGATCAAACAVAGAGAVAWASMSTMLNTPRETTVP